jgi:hypothetical protein
VRGANWIRRAVLLACLVSPLLAWRLWAPFLGQSLICREMPGRSQAMVLENFDPEYLIFERGRELYNSGLAPRIIVPVRSDHESDVPNDVALGFAEVMARVSRLPLMEVVTVRESEPITLNVALQLRAFLIREHISSVIVVVPAFRSRRSSLVYTHVFAPAGIVVRCVPVFGSRTVRNWSDTWHGVQEVGEQLLKLQYYRLWVLW